MSPSPLLYFITDRKAFPGNEPEQRRRLLQKITAAAKAGVDFIQLREKDLPPRDLESLARDAVHILQQLRTENQELRTNRELRTENQELRTGHQELRTEFRTALLINSRTDIALAAGAAGVHLRAGDVNPQVVKEIWLRGAGARENSRRNPIIGVSCHSPQEVQQAADNGATFAVFAPIFEKNDNPSAKPTGLKQLELACHQKIPVFALGGITRANAKSCLAAGAAGIAAIRLFQENDISAVLEELIPE